MSFIGKWISLKSNLSFRPKPMEEFQFSMSKPAGNLIVEWGQLTKAYRQPLFRDFSYKVLEGEKIGVIGPNGAGKSTFFKVLLEQEKPDQGYVSWGSSTKICYWDQSRTLLKDDCTVLENFAEFGERISFGETNPHMIGYLERFLFQRGDLDKKVGKLSGGERARLILARLVAMKGNFLILDEPTNDLDLDTMRLLEEALIAYPGNALMVSHDRYFLDRVCTTVIEIGHSPIPMVSAGNYSLFQLFKSRMRQEEVLPSPAEKAQNREKNQNKPAKLNYRQNQRLLELEHLIADLEKQKSLLENELQKGSLDYLSLQAKSHQLQELEKSLESLMNEWIQLMELKA